MILRALIAILACWIHRHQDQVIAYLQEENRILKAKLGGQRLNLTDTERRRLAVLAHAIDRKRLKDIATIATADTLQRWYRRLVAQAGDRPASGTQPGRPRVAPEIEQLVIRMAEENASRGYRRIQGALANPGYHIDKITVRNILRRHHIDPAPIRRRAGMSWAQFLNIHWDVLTATGFFTVDGATLADVRHAALARVRELSTRCLHLTLLIHYGLWGVMMLWVRQWHSLWAGCLPTTRVWLATCAMRCFRVVGTRRRGSGGQLRLMPLVMSQPAFRQRAGYWSAQERSPPGARCLSPTIAIRRHLWGRGASHARLVSVSSMADDDDQASCRDPIAAYVSCPDQAAA